MAEKKIPAENPAAADIENRDGVADDAAPTVLELSKVYPFEGDLISTLDLEGLNSITTADMIAANNYISRKGIISPMPEMTFEFAAFIAAKATGLPMEFFLQLKAKDTIKVKNRVTSFFYGEE